jgi:peptidoglycan/LPS O-acetylase OafA/YrhL
MGADQESVQPRQPADARNRPYILLVVVAIGAGASILGVFMSASRCGDQPDNLSWDVCWLSAAVFWAPFTGLVAGIFAAAPGPTWSRFLAGLGGLVVGCVVAMTAMDRPPNNVFDALIFSAPAFVVVYGIRAAIVARRAQARAGPAPDSSSASASHDASRIAWIG